jgi:BCD family chlorophyll transporter-like MFS transporter
MGHGSDVGGRRTPWIIGGMAVLASGGVLAAIATVWMATQLLAGTVLAVLGFAMIGIGVSAAGTSLLVLLAKRVAPSRRAAAATIVWMMMILGFALTAGIAGKLLDPYSPERLVMVSAAISAGAMLLTVVALAGLEGVPAAFKDPGQQPAQATPFMQALRQTWADPQARHFTLFVFVSMLAYSAQDLILEPFAGAVFGFTPGESTSLSGVQHGGVLAGMILVALAGPLGQRLLGRPIGSLRSWTIGGCIASALGLLGLVIAGIVGPAWPFRATVFAMGVANGAFSIAAIGSMMQLASQGRDAREGVRMGLWGAAQAVAFGTGGLVGTAASDLARWLIGTPGAAYGAVFLFEALLFALAAGMAAKVGQALKSPSTDPCDGAAAHGAVHRGEVHEPA